MATEIITTEEFVKRNKQLHLRYLAINATEKNILDTSNPDM